MDTANSSSLENLLMLTNLEIIGTQVRLSEIVYKFEGGRWNDAQRKASILVKSNMAMSYLDDVRKTIGLSEPKLNLPAIQQETTTEPVKPISEVKPEEKRNHDGEIFEENYRLLNEFAPELEEELKGLTENGILSGKSATNIHGSASIKSVEKDKYGYFLLLDINESSIPNQSILLYVNATAKTVQVLSVESTDWKFEVYSDIHNRELVNLEQQEIQNKYFNKQLKKLIEFKLSIQTIDVTTIQEPKQEEENTIQFPRRGLQNVNPKPDREWVPSDSVDDDELFADYYEEEREKEELREKNEELEERNMFLENDVYRTFFKQNFGLLTLLIPSLSKELILRSFSVTLRPESSEYTVYKLDFEKVAPHDVNCCIYELNPTSNEYDEKCCFNVMDEQEVTFICNEKGFFGLEEEILVREHWVVSEETVKANSALHTYFLTLLVHKYHSKISNRVYPIQIVKNTPQKQDEIETVEAIEENDDSDGTGTVVAVLATIGLGILGFRLFK
jgi:hypothetical protein